MPVSFSDLLLACQFVSSGGTGENEAYLDRQSGKIYWHSEFGDNDEQLPDDIDDEKYISIPDKRELVAVDGGLTVNCVWTDLPTASPQSQPIFLDSWSPGSRW